MSESRRDTLKIIGAIGTTCAFPFSADELYGQHAHHPPALAQIQPASGTFKPKFFTSPEFETISRIADLIIPPTDTPGAVAAGAPRYIDDVVSANPEHQKTYRDGLKWLDDNCKKRFEKSFVQLNEKQQIETLTPLSDAVDKNQAKSLGELFFRIIKNMTADGYYTSQAGLVQELGYKGNTVLAKFPECDHPEHQG